MTTLAFSLAQRFELDPAEVAEFLDSYLIQQAYDRKKCAAPHPAPQNCVRCKCSVQGQRPVSLNSGITLTDESGNTNYPYWLCTECATILRDNYASGMRNENYANLVERSNQELFDTLHQCSCPK